MRMKPPRFSTMQGLCRFSAFAVTLTVVSIAGGMSFSETPIDEMEQHFAIASKHYGDGQVQVHTRRDSDEGSRHEVLTIDCKEQTFRRDYTADVPPEAFPLGDFDAPSIPVTVDNIAAPTVVHTCEQHGHPLLEWRW